MFNKFLLLLIFLAALLRIASISNVPVFADEANHLRIVDIVRSNPSFLLSSAHGGILPGLIISLAVIETFFMKLFNVLIISRLFSVIVDLLSAFFIYQIGSKLFNKNVAICSTLVYLSIQLNFFHARLVMLEPQMQMFFLLAFLLFTKFNLESVKRQRINLKTLYLIAMLIFLS